MAVTDCELVALLEDDTGMELLVNKKIISLDLPVKDVYKKVWAPEHGEVMLHIKLIFHFVTFLWPFLSLNKLHAVSK